ncbi:MAG: ABC transporter permease [Verrucomicrobia bacterium]|nr:ABC transporter permease [Verrucomicrobiota bacterium]
MARNLLQSLILDPARMVGGLWAHRGLVWQFTRRNIELRHRGSRLGPIWALLTPLSMLVLYFIVFGVIYGQRFGVLPDETRLDFSLALFLGLTLFHAFSETLSASPGLIVANPNFVKKVAFPLEALPLAQLGATLFHLLVGLGLVLLGGLFSSAGLTLAVLWLPVLVLPLLLIALGVAWAAAAIGVFVRDLGQTTSFISTALLFASAVMYPPSKIPPELGLLHWNPLLRLIDLSRRVVLWHEPLPWVPVLQLYAVGLAACVLGAVLFSLLRRSFAEVL